MKQIVNFRILFYGLLLLSVVACEPDNGSDGPEVNPEDSLLSFPHDPIPYELMNPPTFPQMEFPEDNPMTEAGVELGRQLFYDTRLSADNTMACASCHLQEGSFTDNLAVSPGIDGVAGPRSSMSLLDVGYHLNGLFWDGRVSSLEEQALLPVEDPIELHHDWAEVIGELRADEDYPAAFRAAFGIGDKQEITKELAAKALAQFERSLVSSGKSRYDKAELGQILLSDEERMGFQIFFDDSEGELPDGQCFHCHVAPLFTDNLYRNNGLDVAPDFEDFVDLGRGGVTGERVDNGKFRTPTLRNIEFTAPYMHDGRFSTLEEVMDHYVSGGQPSINADPLMDSIFLDNEQKAAVIAFLKTLSDPDFLADERYADPE